MLRDLLLLKSQRNWFKIRFPLFLIFPWVTIFPANIFYGDIVAHPLLKHQQPIMLTVY
jgi:hypothetical protein